MFVSTEACHQGVEFPCKAIDDIDHGRCLELFFQQYAQHCRESGIDMSSKALNAATEMQSTYSTPDSCKYVLNAVVLDGVGVRALFAALTVLPLAVLDLSDCYLGDTGMRVLAEVLSTSTRLVCSLRTIKLRGIGLNDGSSLASLIMILPHLRFIDISSNRLGTQPSGFSLLCKVMGNHPHLQEVHLNDNMISGCCKVCVCAIAEWIVVAGRTCMLQHVDLRFNALGLHTGGFYHSLIDGKEERRGIYGFHPLVDALLLNNALEVFDVRHNGLACDVLDAVGAKLAVNKRTKGVLLELNNL
ncbi:unnamed protein product [Trypanosoma congolense IL3000]|uniref:WGS project CAEQ00000000 data, annotated contig 710 n=1 Tax=Trypanosoma congolense (strain IL3000) TaxID=1068625 RepID=F9WHZ4_TRYCI|nr:unnamed protein product [Trypanosoma congolense IL3000]